MSSRKRHGADSDDATASADPVKKEEPKHNQKHAEPSEENSAPESLKIRAPKASTSSSKKQSSLKSGYSTANDSGKQEKKEKVKKSSSPAHDSDDQEDEDHKPLVCCLIFIKICQGFSS